MENYLVASGPYMIEGSDKLDFRLPPISQPPAAGIRPASMTLVRNPSWTPATDHLRRASVNRIVITPVDPEEAAAKVDRGELDLVADWQAPPDVVARYRAGAALAKRVFQTPADSVLFLPLNIAVPPFDDLHVRKAVSYAIDKEAVLAAFEKGRNALASLATHLAPDSLEHNLLLNFDPYGPDHAGNTAAARAEMAKSKYDRNHDGVCDVPACANVRFLVPDSKPERVAIGRLARADLARIGIHLRLDIVDGPTFFFTRTDPKSRVPITLLESNRGLPSAADFLGGFAQQAESNLGQSPSYLRRNGYRVTRVASVADRVKACSITQFEAAIECWTALDEYLTLDVIPWVPLVGTIVETIASSRVERLTFDQANLNQPVPALDQVVLSRAAAREGPSPEPAPSSVASTLPAIPDGTYSTTVTAGDLVRAGADPTDEFDLQQSSGRYDLTLFHGRWRGTLTSPDVWFAPVATGVYFGSGDRVTLITQTPGVNAITVTLRWRFDGHTLRLKVLDPGFKDALPWVRGLYESHGWTQAA